MLGALYEQDLKGVSSIKEAKTDLMQIWRAIRQALLVPSREAREAQGKAVATWDHRWQQDLQTFKKTLVTPEEHATVAALEKD
jgi:hypothetical protein